MHTDGNEFTFRMVVVTTPDGRNIWENYENHVELEDWVTLVEAVSNEFPTAFPYELFLEVVWEPESCAEKTSRAWGFKWDNGHPGTGFLNRRQWMGSRKRRRVLESTERFGSDPIKFIKEVCRRLAPEILHKELNYGVPSAARESSPRRGIFSWQARNQAQTGSRGGAGTPQSAQGPDTTSTPEPTPRPTVGRRAPEVQAAQEPLQEPTSSGSTGRSRTRDTQAGGREGEETNRTAPRRGGVGTPEGWEPKACGCPICINTDA